MNTDSLPSQPHQISIRQLLVWTAFLACYFAAAANLVNTASSIAAGTVTAAVFIYVDTRRKHSRIIGLSLSFFACGLAGCVAAMFLGLAYLPHPASPNPGPPMPFLVGVLYVLSGQWLADFSTAIGQAILAMVLYFLTFAGFAVLSTILAIPYFRKYGGWKIVLVNTPGLLYSCYVIMVITWENMKE